MSVLDELLELFDLGKSDIDGEHLTSAFSRGGRGLDCRAYLDTRRAESLRPALTIGPRILVRIGTLASIFFTRFHARRRPRRPRRASRHRHDAEIARSPSRSSTASAGRIARSSVLDLQRHPGAGRGRGTEHSLGAALCGPAVSAASARVGGRSPADQLRVGAHRLRNAWRPVERPSQRTRRHPGEGEREGDDAAPVDPVPTRPVRRRRRPRPRETACCRIVSAIAPLGPAALAAGASIPACLPEQLWRSRASVPPRTRVPPRSSRSGRAGSDRGELVLAARVRGAGDRELLAGQIARARRAEAPARAWPRSVGVTRPGSPARPPDRAVADDDRLHAVARLHGSPRRTTTVGSTRAP